MYGSTYILCTPSIYYRCIFVSIYLKITLSNKSVTYLIIYLSSIYSHLSIYLSIAYICIYLSITYLSIYLPIYLISIYYLSFIYLSICLGSVWGEDPSVPTDHLLRRVCRYTVFQKELPDFIWLSIIEISYSNVSMPVLVSRQNWFWTPP